jgi:predicted HicB family RNase H-like nuclease
MNTFTYKDYVGSAEVSIDDDCMFGKIQHINDVVTYEAQTIPLLRIEFEKAVDDYLETCAELGKDPERSFTGKTNVRMSPELHRAMTLRATQNSRTLNAEIVASMEVAVAPKRGRRQDDMVEITTSAPIKMGPNSKPAILYSHPSHLRLVYPGQAREA